MSEQQIRIEVPGAGDVTAIETGAEGTSAGWRFIYAPGAGSNVHDPFGAFACRWLAERGVDCARFQFPYQEAKRRSPDRPPVLEATWRAVIEALQRQAESRNSRLVVGGRSMGGRIASQVVAQGTAVDALALFAYPLHPPGKPEQRRQSHLSQISVPTLFCSGANDAFASPEELSDAAAMVLGSRVHSLGEGVDHGFAARKSTGKTRDDVWRDALEAKWSWLVSL